MADANMVDTGRRKAAQIPSGDYLDAMDNGDELNSSIVVGKYHRHLQSDPPTKSYGKGDGASFANELGYFNSGNHASKMNNRKRSTNPVNHQPKRRTVCQNISEKKHLDTDGRKLDLKICAQNRQKNNSIESKGMSHKLHTEDLPFGSPAKRWDHSKNQTYQYERFNTRNVKMEVVILDDEDTKPATSVDVEMAKQQ